MVPAVTTVGAGVATVVIDSDGQHRALPSVTPQVTAPVLTTVTQPLRNRNDANNPNNQMSYYRNHPINANNPKSHRRPRRSECIFRASQA